jgi:hypothetical protein
MVVALYLRIFYDIFLQYFDIFYWLLVEEDLFVEIVIVVVHLIDLYLMMNDLD